ncbi:hypothetical protein ACHAWF_001617 [Thalassiosira exigua]
MATTRLAAKRRKTAPVEGRVDGGGDGILGILDLPDAALAKVGEFVPKTSAALLAVAFTAPPSSWRQGGWKGRPSPAAVAVLSSISCRGDGNDGWDILDFEDVHRSVKRSRQHDDEGDDESGSSYENDSASEIDESGEDKEESSHEQTRQHNDEGGDEREIGLKSNDVETTLANRLGDDDLGAVLACLDASNKMKRLKLAGCVNIDGRGLEPLRGSLVVQQIDLSLVEEHMEPWIRIRQRYTPSPISLESVIPILRSIIQEEGSALKHLQFPAKWFKKPLLETFMAEFSDVLDRRQMDCSHCHRVHPRTEDGMNQPSWFISYSGFAIQRFTCYKCLKSNCQFIKDDECGQCHKYYCDGCVPEKVRCHSCERLKCIECTRANDCEVCGNDEDVICHFCYADKYYYRCCHMCGGAEEKVCYDCSDMLEGGCGCRKTVCNQCLIYCSYCSDYDCGESYLNCENCEKTSCASCARKKEAVCKCNECERQYCLRCRQEKEGQDEASFCRGCAKIVKRRSRSEGMSDDSESDSDSSEDGW